MSASVSRSREVAKTGKQPKIITLTGEPKSTQNIYRAVCRGSYPVMYMTHEGKTIKESYQWEAKSQWKDSPLQDDVALSIRFFFGTKRKCDADNFNKLVLDSLTGIVYDDDSQIQDLRLLKDYDKERPRVEIEVSTYPPQPLA